MFAQEFEAIYLICVCPSNFLLSFFNISEMASQCVSLRLVTYDEVMPLKNKLS